MFFILGYPKSRTTWLSCFLTDSSHPCYHEKSTDFSSFKEMEDWCKNNQSSGIVDTALLIHYKKILTSITDRVVIIDREVEDVKASLAKEGFSEDCVDALSPFMEEAKKDHKVKVVDYRNLSEKETLEDICKYVGIDFDEERYSLFKECVINTNTPVFLERVYSSKEDYRWLLEG